ncbi:MAG: hypothetical protein Fur0019_17380 [Tibeticola sp.]
MYELLQFLKRKLYFKRKPSEPARLSDVLKAADHAQSQLDALFHGLSRHLCELDGRLTRIESRIDFILGVLECTAHLDEPSRERHQRVLGLLEERLRQEIAACMHQPRAQGLTGPSSRTLEQQRLLSLIDRLELVQQALARLKDRPLNL